MENNRTENGRCVICAAGPVARPDGLRDLLCPGDFVIAADGGLRLAEALGLKPDLIVADFDSSPRSLAEQTDAPITLLPVKKNDTDVMAAARIAFQKGFREALLLGATGGRLDHTMANLAVVLFLVKNGVRTVLADETNRLEMLLPGSYTVRPAAGFHLSLLPYAGNAEGVTVKNAEYELCGAKLTPDFPLGVSNEFLNLPVEISFESGILMRILSKD